jgi:hypothetical protein
MAAPLQFFSGDRRDDPLNIGLGQRRIATGRVPALQQLERDKGVNAAPQQVAGQLAALQSRAPSATLASSRHADAGAARCCFC